MLVCAYEKKTLMWKDVSSFVHDKTNVWVSGGGQRWVKLAWDAVTKAELAGYRDEIERHIVLIRLMTLMMMYLEFCDLVWDESFEKEDIVREGWIEDGGIFDSIRIWQIIGTDFYRDEGIGGADKTDLLTEALIHLIDKHRKEVYEALERGWGGDDKLFVSMLASPDIGDAETQDSLTDVAEEICKSRYGEDYSGMGVRERRGLDWVTLGMPSCSGEHV